MDLTGPALHSSSKDGRSFERPLEHDEHGDLSALKSLGASRRVTQVRKIEHEAT
jgi:hypothetical protein